MRILHVTPYAGDAWAYGGIPRIVHVLARGLARRGHYLTVCTTDACDAGTRLRTPSAPDPNVDLRIFENLSNTLAYRLQLFAPRGLSAFLRASAGTFDVAHLHAWRNAPGAIAAHHLARAGVPYLVAPNGTAALVERRRLAKRLYDRALGRRQLARAARVQAVSEAERRQLIAMGVPDGRLRVVPNPIDLDEFRRPLDGASFRARLGIGGSERLVLYLGTLMRRKRVDVLIRAFAGLDRGDARLVIAGNDMGAGREARALVRASGLGPRVVFTGLLRGTERLAALAAADVVVYPSEHEVFGLVALESLMAGTPVIVADDSGCGELVRAVGGGPVVPVGDADALARAMQAVLDEAERWRLRIPLAQDRIRQAYAADVVCAALEAVYVDMVNAA